jgi:hypothetical protein
MREGCYEKRIYRLNISVMLLLPPPSPHPPHPTTPSYHLLVSIKRSNWEKALHR